MGEVACLLILNGHHGAREALLVAAHEVVSRKILVQDGLVLAIGSARNRLGQSDLVSGLPLGLFGGMRGRLLVLAQVLADRGGLMRCGLLIVVEVNDYLAALVVVHSVLLNDDAIFGAAALVRR